VTRTRRLSPVRARVERESATFHQRRLARAFDAIKGSHTAASDSQAASVSPPNDWAMIYPFPSFPLAKLIRDVIARFNRSKQIRQGGLGRELLVSFDVIEFVRRLEAPYRGKSQKTKRGTIRARANNRRDQIFSKIG